MNNLKLTSIALIVLMTIAIWNTSVQASSHAALPALKLQNLFEERPIILKAKKENLLYVTFFEDKCRWCLRQMSAYQKYQHKMKADFVMVGVGDSKYKLRHWAKRARTDIPVAFASDELLSLVGTPKVTPYTLIFDSEGQFLTKVTGYIKPDTLEQMSFQLALTGN